MRNDAERRMEQLEAEIAHTRADMDATLNAIEDRFTTGQLIDQGLDYLRHSSAQEFVSNLGSSVKQNPLPVTLVGLGLAWLMMAGNTARRRDLEDEVFGPTYGTGESHGLRERASEAMHRVSEAGGSAMESMSETASSARETVSHAAESARQRAAQMRASVRHQVERARGGVQHQVERARGGYEYVVHQQPLALGAIGLAVGAVIAASLPRTRQEDRLMGAARDRMAEQAKAAGKEQLDKAQRVAEAAGKAASAEAEREGFATPPQPRSANEVPGMEDDWDRDLPPEADTQPGRDVHAAPGADPNTGMPGRGEEPIRGEPWPGVRPDPRIPR
jgi:ElaB/YqjD/DUF883 family membrane-anchored ribosome-binding protein